MSILCYFVIMIKNEFILKSKSDKNFLCDIRYVEDGNQKPIILFVHGFKGFKDWGHFNLIADYFAKKGFVYVKLNLSHNGTNPENPIDFVDLDAFGKNNFSIELDDLGYVIDYLFSDNPVIHMNEIDLDKLNLIGHSRGGGLVLLKTAEDKRVKKVVTFAAIHDLEKRWPQSFIDDWKDKGVQYVYNGRTEQDMPLYYQLVEDFLANSDRLNIPERVKEIKVPLLITHGTEDVTLDVSMANELASWNKGAELCIIEEANHVFGGSHPFNENELPKHSKILVERTLEFLNS